MRVAIASLTMTIAVAAGSVTAVTGAAPAGPAASARPVSLSALIIQGSSTNQGGDGIAGFYGGRFAAGEGDIATINFLTGPYGILQALRAEDDDEPDAVLSSGWGAANASLTLSHLSATGDPLLNGSTWVLDNNVANPNGGFGTRYPLFALIGVNPLPTGTPELPGGPTVISTATEYDINSNAPKYVLNPVADLNSLATYLDGRLGQGSLTLPVDDAGNPGCEQCGVDTDDRGVTTVTFPTGHPVKTATVEKVGGVTYVGYHTDELPLLAPLRSYGGDTGKKLATALEPSLRAVVNYGYPDNDPLGNPGDYQPAGLIPSARETRTFLREFRAGVRKGVSTLTGDDTPGARNSSNGVRSLASGVAARRERVDRPKPATATREVAQRAAKALGLDRRSAKALNPDRRPAKTAASEGQ